jgi:trk system potassium uptake protein TrkH
MNYASIGRFLGLAFAAFGAIFLLCLASGLAWDGAHFSIVWRWLFCGGVAVLLSLSLLCLGRFPREKIFHREAFAITAFVWIFAIVLGTLPYLLFVPGMDLADAIFESTSGLTSTGSTVLFRLDDLPRSLLFFRAMTQWIGGLGIVLFFVVFLPSLDRKSVV